MTEKQPEPVKPDEGTDASPLEEQLEDDAEKLREEAEEAEEADKKLTEPTPTLT